MSLQDLGRRLYALPIRIYRVLISPLLPPSCIYTPTCSSYAHTAILRHGMIRGTILAVARVGRCVGGLYRGGEDEVPDTFTFSEVARGYRVFRRRRREPRIDHDGEGK